MSEVAESSAVVSVTQAARLAGVARSTINRKIKHGDMSRAQGGGVRIAELKRVFGELKTPESVEAKETERNGLDDISQLPSVPRWLIEHVKRLQNQNESLLKQLAEKDETIREANSRAERRAEAQMRQVDRLTDRLLQTEPKRGFLARIRGDAPTGVEERPIAGNKNLGSSFDDFLEGEGQLESATDVATRRLLAWQLIQFMGREGLSKAAMAERMGISSSALSRVLDPENESVTLSTLQKAAAATGQCIEVRLVAA